MASILTWQLGKGLKPGSDAHTVKTSYWHRLADDRVQCDLCPRACKLREGQRGLCFVRVRENNEVVLKTYGRSSGFCIDPIEKKPLNHFLPGTPVLSFGTAGCNLACKFCQNWDMSKSREMQTLADAASPEQLAETAAGLGCRSIAYTYNDPVIFHEYAIDVAQAAAAKGIQSVAVTAGYICPEPRKTFFQHMDAANIDLKAFSERFYHRICGGHLADVLDTLLYVKHETSVWLELTTLLIPGENDDPAEIASMCKWVADNLGADVPMHFSAFHPDYKMMDKPATPPKTLTNAREVALAHGINHVYTGNVHDATGGSTWCPQCESLLIERDWYQLGRWHLDAQGCCKSCGHHLFGVFDDGPGNWGPKRQPVSLNR